MENPTHPSFPDLTDMELGVLYHVLSCPSENTVERLFRWSTFGSMTEPEKQRRNCTAALVGLSAKGYFKDGELTDQAFLYADWVASVRRNPGRVVVPEDLELHVFWNPKPGFLEVDSVSVYALSHNDAVDRAVDRLSGRGVSGGDFRGWLIFNGKFEVPLDRTQARWDINHVTRDEVENIELLWGSVADAHVDFAF